jgi:hypothetical protein
VEGIGCSAWRLGCSQEDPAKELARGSLEARIGLTPAAAALFEWIQAQTAFGLELGLTDVVEKAIEAEALLLECPWERDNFPLFLRLLCDEITRCTNWEVEAVPWIKYGTQHRIWVKVSPAPVP